MNILIVNYGTMLLFASRLGDGVTPDLMPQRIVGLGANNCWFHRWNKFAVGLILDYFHCEKCDQYAVAVRENDARDFRDAECNPAVFKLQKWCRENAKRL